MFREWSVSDLARDDVFDGTTTYNVIEAFETNDRVSKKDLARPVRNVFENQKDNFEFLENWSYFTSMNNGVIKDALVSEFEFKGDSDIFNITLNPGTGDTTQYYMRLVPGIAMNRGKLAVNRPHTHIAERQLTEIFNLQSYGTEGVEIKYYHNVDLFQARIKRKDINGTTVNHDFLNGGTWGDSDGGYDSGLQLLEAIYGDTIYFRDEFADAVGTNLLLIDLEPAIRGDSGDTYYWYVDRNGNFVGDTIAAGDSWALSLYTVSVAPGGDSSDYWLDQRTYVQNFNDFGQYMFLNVPQDWGDTDTVDFTNPYGDSNLAYADITNQNTYLVFLRKSAGDTEANSIFGWSEDNIPGISETRSDKFFMNKDLLVRWGDSAGDTLGASWASIEEMSGDSWAFYGNKVFQQGLYEFHSNDSTADSFKIDTVGGIDIDTDEGFAFNDDSGALLTIDNAGVVNLTSIGNMTLTSGGDLTFTVTDDLVFSGDTITWSMYYFNVDVTTFDLDATGQINLTSSQAAADAIRIYASNAAGGIDIDSDDITIDASSGHFGITTAGRVDIDAAAGALVDITSNTEIQLAGGALIDIDGTQVLIDAGASGVDITAAAGDIGINTSTSGSIVLTSAGTGDSIHLDSGNDIVLYAEDEVSITGGDGNSFITIAEATASTITIDANGSGADVIVNAVDDIQLNSGGTADILLDAGANEVDITATLVDINGTTTDLDGTTFTANYTDALFVTGDSFGVTSTGGINLLENSGAYFRITAAGQVNMYSASGQNLNIFTVGTGDMTIDSDDVMTINSDGTMTLDTTGAMELNSDGGMSLTDDSGSFINIESDGDIVIDGDSIAINGDQGIFIRENSGSEIVIATGGNLDLTSVGDIGLTAAGDTITLTSNTTLINTTTTRIDGTTLDVNAATLDVDSLTGIQFTSNGQFNIDLNTSTSASAFKIDTIGGIDLDTDTGFALNDDSGAYFTITTAGIANLYSASNQNLNIVAQGSGNMALTAAGDSITMTAASVGVVGTLDIQGTNVLEFNNSANARMNYEATCSGRTGTTTDNGVTVTGSFAAYKVYNAVWNDYAEGFEYDKEVELKPKPGLVYKQTETGLVRTEKRAEKAVIGIYTDTAGMVMGSKDTILPDMEKQGEDQSAKTKLPIALAGKVRVWVSDNIEIGDILVGGRDGMAKKATLFERIFKRDALIGKALEPNKSGLAERKWVLIK